jgi:hypothetical protein
MLFRGFNMNFKVGDKAIMICSHHPSYGKIYTVLKVENHMFYANHTDSFDNCGKYHQTGAGYLGNPEDAPMLRKLTPLELVML